MSSRDVKGCSSHSNRPFPPAQRPALEGLEPRMLLSGVEWLPGLVGPDDFVEHTTGQVIYLDFDGAQDVTYNGPVMVEGIDIPAFSTRSIGFADQEPDLIEAVTARVSDLLSPFGVTVIASLPEVCLYSTIYIGGTDDAFSVYGDFSGLAEAIDVGNVDHRDEGLVFAESVGRVTTSRDEYCLTLAGIVAHEGGHLLGLVHGETAWDDMSVAGGPVEGGGLARLAYTMDEGEEAHQWITKEAYDFYASQFEGAELTSYLTRPGLSPTSAWSSIADASLDYNGNNNILEGTADEDRIGRNPSPFGSDHYLMPYVYHFCAGGDGSKLYDGLGAWDSAYTTASWYWSNYVLANYSQNKALSYYYLGHAIHLLEDMAVPAHVHNDQHLVVDNYEATIGAVENFQLWGYGNGSRGGPSGSIDLPGSLLSLFRDTADYTEEYDSDEGEGHDVSQWPNTGDHRPDLVSRGDGIDINEITVMGDDLVPWAMEQVAGLFRLFYSQVDLTAPTAYAVNGLSSDVDNPTIKTTPAFSVSCNAASDPQSGIDKDGYTFQTWKWLGSDWSSATDWGDSERTRTIGPLSPGIYAIQVVAENGGGRTGASPFRYFQVVTDPPPPPRISARTSSGGSSISPSTWQGDDDPYFHWSVPNPNLPIVGYSIALDGQPNDSVNTANTYWQYSSGALANGTHTFYVKAKDSAGQWGPAGSFSIWVDDAGDAISSLSASEDGFAVSAGGWVGNGNVDFAWTAASNDSPIVGYSVAWDSTPDSSVETSVTSYTPDKPGIGQHIFNVRAIDAAGNSGPVASFTVKVGSRQYVVNSLADGGSITDGQFTLREALVSANANSAPSDARANSSFIGYADRDRIVFDAGLFAAGPGTITLGGTQLDIADNLVLDGPGDDILTIDANDMSRVMYVRSDADIDGLTITGGSPAGFRSGGGICNLGALTLTNTTISGNSAREGGGIDNFHGYLTLTNSTVSGNSASYRGGGIHINSSAITLTNSTVSGNSARYGGGICSRSRGEITLTNSTVSGNSASNDGGGIHSSIGYLTLTNTIVALNEANGHVDDIYGDVHGMSNLLGIDPSFVRNPSDGGDGWGDDPGTTDVDEGANDDYGDLRLTATSVAVNFMGDASLLPADTADLDGDGDTSEPIPFDLDGNPRVVDGVVDVGAYEYQGTMQSGREAPALEVSSLADIVDIYDGAVTLREAILYAGLDSTDSEITFASSLFASGAATITLGSGGTPLRIAEDMQIAGPGANLLTVDAGGRSRVFSIFNGEVGIESIRMIGGAASSGGGIYNEGTLTLTNITVSGNSANDYGGGIFNSRGTLTLTNTTVSGNSANDRCGGIYNSRGTLTLTNTTVSGNSANDYGGGIYSYSDLTLTNTIVALNDVNGHVDDVYGDVHGTGNLLGIDPSFVRNPSDGGDGWGDDPGTTDVDEGANDDYGDLRLTATSVAVNFMGDASLLPADTADLDGDGDTSEPIPFDLDGGPRVVDGVVDVGAYEYQGAIQSGREVPSLEVSSLADIVDIYDGAVTLREAILYAGLDSTDSEITFASSLFASGAATITLDGMPLLIAEDMQIAGPRPQTSDPRPVRGPSGPRRAGTHRARLPPAAGRFASDSRLVIVALSSLRPTRTGTSVSRHLKPCR